MPGLSQLKKFSTDIISLGNETSVRAARGEKPVIVSIPKSVQDVDDSEEFVLGMPEIEAAVEETPVEEDLSDLTGLVNPAAKKTDEKAEAAPSAFEAPDMSDLLAPMGGDSDDETGMPDLSMFMEPEEQEEEIVEEEPEEVSIADMGLDALLAGGGFDQPEDAGQPESEENSTSEQTVTNEFENIDDIDSIEELTDEPSALDTKEPAAEIPEKSSSDDDFDIFKDMGIEEPVQTESKPDGAPLDLDELVSFDEAPAADEPQTAIPDSSDGPGDLGDLGALGDLGDLNFDEPAPAASAENAAAADDFDFDEPAASAAPLDDFNLDEPGAPAAPLDDFNLDEPAPAADLGMDEPAAEPLAADDFNLDDLSFDTQSDSEIEEAPAVEAADAEVPAADEPQTAIPDSSDGPGDLGDLGALGDLGDLNFDEPAPAASAENAAAADDFNLDEPAASAAPLDDFNLDEPGAPAAPSDDFNLDEPTPATDLGMDEPAAEPLAADDFNLDDLSFDTQSDSEIEEAPAVEAADAEVPVADEPLSDIPDASGDLGNLGDLGDLGDLNFDEPAASAENAAPADDFNLDESAAPEAPLDDLNLDEPAPATDLSMDEPAAESNTDEEPAGPSSEDLLGGLDFDMPDDAGTDSSALNLDTNGMDDFDFGGESVDNPVNVNADEEIPDYGGDSDFDLDSLNNENADEGAESDQPLEVFDTSEMEGLDFGIPDTDAQLSGGAGGDFELGNNDDFSMEGDFEIPGFSDVQTAKEEKSKPAAVASKTKDKKSKSKDIDEADFSEAVEAEDLPPNTLSDAQYKVFLKNLSEYPLNVRLAFEDLIVQNEFTDDAEFEVIEKILNKAPARQVAGLLEKMLDTSIPVPRDFEHRTAEEYEAYKKSLSYQLKNKIIPLALVGVLLFFVGLGLVKFVKNCIYNPLMASKYYKQGYVLLQKDEYPQAEKNFNDAKHYRISKKWFFNYARGYREHKQYQRASDIYKEILRYFNHDKAAGLEYADMELSDLANYERAEEIVKREVLDYHINDKDGLLLLGDIYLEWGTEKDSEKLEQAREQYASLLQLYGQTDLYLSRMMRFFIRTDNLRQVLQVKQTFEPREKSLSSEDWTELSGYLLDKYYGPLAPSDEYLRYEIEGLRKLLLRAVKTNPDNPIALYNLSRYFVNTNETASIESTLQKSIEKFNSAKSMKKRDIYKYINAYRLLGEHYMSSSDYLKAQEQFAEGISLYTTERDNAGFEGNAEIGKMYEDLADIKYTVSGDYDEALQNYKYSVELENDSPSIRYRIGYIQYKFKNYAEALGSFMKAGDGNVKERNLMLAMANTLSLRGDDYAAEGYYSQLLSNLDDAIAKRGIVFPQANDKDYDVVSTYLYAANNYGVTLYRLAKRTGNSNMNAQAMVQFSQSVRAWDSLTRNQATLVRLPGSNLAEQNIKYVSHPMPEFEPAIYTEISKTLFDKEKL